MSLIEVTVVVPIDWSPPLHAPESMDYFRTSYMDEAYMSVAGAIRDMLSATVDYVTPSIVVEYITRTSLKHLADNLSNLIYINVDEDIIESEGEERPPIILMHNDIVQNSPYLLSICYSMLVAALSKLAGPSIEIYYAHFIPPILVDIEVTDYADYLKYVIENEVRH